MDCGAKDFICYLISLLAEHGVEVSGALKWAPWIRETFVENIQAIIGVLGFSFGVWRWWYFREKVLHKRLKKYLREQDQRLTDAQSYVVDALYRPGGKRFYAEPLFAVSPLRRVLRRKNWESVLNVKSIETGAERLLDKALRRIESRLEAADQQLRSYRKQQASAHILKGAIASARAPNKRFVASRTQLDTIALNEFRTALQVAGHERDARTKLFEAKQLRKLGYVNEAEEAFRIVEEFADADPELDQKSRDFIVAESKQGRASIQQAWSIARCQQQAQGTPAAPIANQLATGARGRRSQHAPFHNWDAIEQGDLHYLAAFIHNRRGAINLEPQQLDKAATEYHRVVNSIPRSRRLASASARRLFDAASAGLDRVGRARSGEYDESWLLPPLVEQSQQEATTVGETSSQKTVEETS